MFFTLFYVVLRCFTFFTLFYVVLRFFTFFYVFLRLTVTSVNPTEVHKYFFFFFQNKGKKTPSDRRVVYFMRWLPLINPPWIMRCNPAGDWSHFSKTLIAICCAEEIIMLSRAVFCDLPPGALVAAHYLFCGSAFTDRSPSKLVWDILWPANFVGLIRCFSNCDRPRHFFLHDISLPFCFRRLFRLLWIIIQHSVFRVI